MKESKIKGNVSRETLEKKTKGIGGIIMNNIDNFVKKQGFKNKHLWYEKEGKFFNVAGQFNDLKFYPLEYFDMTMIKFEEDFREEIFDKIRHWDFENVHELINDLHKKIDNYIDSGNYTIKGFRYEHQKRFEKLWMDFNGDARVKKILYDFITGKDKITHKEAHQKMCNLK